LHVWFLLEQNWPYGKLTLPSFQVGSCRPFGDWLGYQIPYSAVWCFVQVHKQVKEPEIQYTYLA
jgi:hypothetical protein